MAPHRKESDWQRLEEDNAKLKQQISLLKQENISLAQQLSEFKEKLTIADVNFKILAKTAADDIERKDRMVQEARKAKDDVIFRRRKTVLRDEWTMTEHKEMSSKRTQTTSSTSQVQDIDRRHNGIRKELREEKPEEKPWSRKPLNRKDLFEPDQRVINRIPAKRLRSPSVKNSRSRSRSRDYLKHPIRNTKRSRIDRAEHRTNDLREKIRHRRHADRKRSRSKDRRKHSSPPPPQPITVGPRTPPKLDERKDVSPPHGLVETKRLCEVVAPLKLRVILDKVPTITTNQKQPDPVLLEKATKMGRFNALEYLWEERQQEIVPGDPQEESISNLLITPQRIAINPVDTEQPVQLNSKDSIFSQSTVSPSENAQFPLIEVFHEELEEGEIADDSQSATGDATRIQAPVFSDPAETKSAICAFVPSAPKVQVEAQHLIDDTACDLDTLLVKQPVSPTPCSNENLSKSETLKSSFTACLRNDLVDGANQKSRSCSKEKVPQNCVSLEPIAQRTRRRSKQSMENSQDGTLLKLKTTPVQEPSQVQEQQVSKEEVSTKANDCHNVPLTENVSSKSEEPSLPLLQTAVVSPLQVVEDVPKEEQPPDQEADAQSVSNESLKENTPSFNANAHRAGHISTPKSSTTRNGEPKQLLSQFNETRELSSIRDCSNEKNKSVENKSAGNTSGSKIMVTKAKIYEMVETEEQYVITVTRRKKKKKAKIS